MRPKRCIHCRHHKSLRALLILCILFPISKEGKKHSGLPSVNAAINVPNAAAPTKSRNIIKLMKLGAKAVATPDTRKSAVPMKYA